MDVLPDELLCKILVTLSLADAARASAAGKRWRKLLRDAAPEVAGGWERVPPHLPGESWLQHLQFLYARNSQARTSQARTRGTGRMLYAWFGGRPLTLSALYAAVHSGDGGGLALGGGGEGSYWLQNVAQVAIAESDADFMGPRHHSHGLVLDQLGDVWSFGDNAYGSLGVVAAPPVLPVASDISFRAADGNRLHRVATLPVCELVVAAGHSSAAVSTDGGELYVWGCNLGGKLGVSCATGPCPTVPQPTRCLFSKPVAHAAIGLRHMLVVARDGSVYGCGSNASMQLGLGEEADACPTLTPLDVPERVVQAAAGNEHSLLLLASGRLLGAGTANSGELGEALAGCVCPHFMPAFMGKDAWLPTIQDVQAMCSSTALISVHGALFVSGLNAWGSYTTPTRVALEPVTSCSLTPSLGVMFTTAAGGLQRFKGSHSSSSLHAPSDLRGLRVSGVAASMKIFTALV
jgi:hypothetical protein